MTLTQMREITAPSVTPRKGTLLDAATVTDDYAWMDEAGLFDSYNCLTFLASPEFCAPNDKEFDEGIPWQSGFRFGAYGGLTCRSIGLDQARMLSEVTRVFNLGEHVAVEQAFVDRLSLTGAAIPDGVDGEPLWVAPEALTPNATTTTEALARLEAHAASSYVGLPTIHMTVSAASYLTGNGRLTWDGNVLRTALGSKVVAGAGYPLGTTTQDMYATGEVWLGRSEPIIRQVMAHTANDVYVLAERAYLLAIDCYAAKITYTPTYS